MFKLFDKNTAVSVAVKNPCSAVLAAARDLIRDLRRLSGRADGFELSDEGAVTVSTISGEPESYTITVSESGVDIVGGDVLGAVFGIYAFSTKVLGVPETFRMTDLFPPVRESMEISPVSISSTSRKVVFRGWFLNDEDLLTEFKESGGVRHIDYRFYHSTMHTDVLDAVLETALRHEINLIIPSSFVDIDNPDEEKLVKTVYDRGLYITQHHVEPLGVSYFGAKNYMEKRGIDGAISFISGRAVMEEIWEYYAKKWAEYKDRVVWQFGLRGRADEAVWKRDKNAPMSSEGRGALITDAINTQYEIVKRTLGGERFLSTATLWLEGARLYGEGHLKLPEDTVAIFSDVGLDQMFGDDFYKVPRLDGKKYGIYYHLAFYGRGPHLADSCNPLKMQFSYKEAARLGSLYYSIVNVSNLRPVHYSVSANARLMADVEGFDYNEYEKEFHQKVFGKAAKLVSDFRKRFYLACGNMGEGLLKELCDEDDFYFHDYGNLPFMRYTFDDGDLYMTGRHILKGIFSHYDEYAKLLPELTSSAERFEALYKDMVNAESEIPAESLDYFKTFLEYQTFYMAKSSRWCALCLKMNMAKDDELEALRSDAIAYLKEIIAVREIEARGDWRGWHKGEKKLNLLECIELTKNFAVK